MKRKHLHKLYILIITICVAILPGCYDEDDPGTPIFADVEPIYASYSGGTFYFSPTDDTEYIVIGFFGINQIETTGKTIINMNQMTRGNRTGLIGMTRSSVAAGSMYVYDDAVKNFTTTSTVSGNHYWAVWGFNADWVIVCASAQKQNNIP